MEKLPRFTNIFSRIETREEADDESLIVLEATAPFPFELTAENPCLCRLKAIGKLSMYPGPLEVRDGVVRQVLIREEGAGQVGFLICLEVPSGSYVTVHEGLPVRVAVHISRRPVREFYQGRRIVIDPGHGGPDTGHRGPVNLWEKDVVLIAAREISTALKRLGAGVAVTREGEENPSWEERIKKAEPGTDLFLSIHAHGNIDRTVRGTAIKYNPRAEDGEVLARMALEAITTKTKMPARGVEPCRNLEELGKVPALLLEIATITNWVDEGILRNPHFYRKLTLATLSAFYHFSLKVRH
ncbi:MAG: N-acetylmuramoyl-L-alanine amidase [Thermanaeromonas sp.]|uniref:N-acetylmuramoyl-L-alanine amidase n=1 Tax=Thermanaeromonas sp. TaxID=2003697 RepID=UPI002440B2C8|nr:N-acetylmuramoyl-L-alanine amidase [Thermanaeromonas sp.]MCG0278849.1 N-acetylmuramoyl-L-alanine amidase [Thermanaeromonas sp.]